ncbi:hypothetical protein CJ030_MR8G019279 [Morella rubra]|uniref:Myb/SANT-like domain-containing protein n=1 Tax=Morella rubra TaxID=262757 RepID=A0A6A1UNL8_9ROSI|nr:hypothetical protein CJ030_MR8G019279 [Morella rubra]
MTRRPIEKLILHREDAAERRRNLVPNVEAAFQRRRRRRASGQPNHRTPGSRTRSSSAASAPQRRHRLPASVFAASAIFSGPEKKGSFRCNPRPPLQPESRCDVQDLKERTGFGWNPETKTVTADVDHWSALIQRDDKYAKFMGRGLDHYDDLCYIFGNNTASGLYHYTPSQDPATSDEEQRLYDAALGRAARSNVPRAASPSTPGEGSSGRRKRLSPTPSGVRSRKMRSGESLNDSFEEASENFLRARVERIANSNLSRSSLVNECVDALMAIQPSIGEEAMGRVMDRIIQSSTFRQAFLRLPEEARRSYVLYLK